VAPGAEITVASVRRHIKHRLNAAKETCDNTLKKAIDNMTRFADEQKAAQIMQAEMDDQPLDYFDALSDSPLVDAEESEVEGGDMFDDGFRSRHGESVRTNGVSRQRLTTSIDISSAQPETVHFPAAQPRWR
jgi:serine/threonine-protein kinase RIM15